METYKEPLPLDTVTLIALLQDSLKKNGNRLVKLSVAHEGALAAEVNVSSHNDWQNDEMFEFDVVEIGAVY